jgi:hypothetical protein
MDSDVTFVSRHISEGGFVFRDRMESGVCRQGEILPKNLLDLLLSRPGHSKIIRVSVGTESQVFKSNFDDCADVIAVDFTRTVESVSFRLVTRSVYWDAWNALYIGLFHFLCSLVRMRRLFAVKPRLR